LELIPDPVRHKVSFVKHWGILIPIRIDYPTALTNTMLAQTTDDNETSSSTSLKEGFEMARLAASTNTQSSFFDSNILSYSLATRAHL